MSCFGNCWLWLGKAFMGAAASTQTVELTSQEKAEIAQAVKDKYAQYELQLPNEKRGSKNEKELLDALRSAYEAASVKVIEQRQRMMTSSSAPVLSPSTGLTATTPLPEESHGQAKKLKWAVVETPCGDDEGESYEFAIRNNFEAEAHKATSTPNTPNHITISKIEGPAKLLRAKTSTELLHLATDSNLDNRSKIEQFISQLRAGEVLTKNKSEFRQRRLTYSQQTVSDPDQVVVIKSPPPNREKRAVRTTIFASSEIGVRQEKSAPFPPSVMGTYSCHGIEPALDEEDGVHEKINQDRGCVVYPYNSSRSEALFMVLDGHGEQGDKVSEFVMRQIVVSLEKDPVLQSDPCAALRNAYITTNTALLVTDIHYMTSGCTCVTIYVRGGKLFVANAGDSRAVMAVKEGDAFLAKDLTRDHKPDEPDEQQRIESWGGFVCPPHEEGLSARVYLDPEFTMIGLAMSRSIGDHAVKNVGVTAEPEIKIFDVSEKDEFMIMASDGVWEFISSQEAVEIVQSCILLGGSLPDACQDLIEAAASRWQDEEGDYRDDITCIVVKFPLPLVDDSLSPTTDIPVN